MNIVNVVYVARNAGRRCNLETQARIDFKIVSSASFAPAPNVHNVHNVHPSNTFRSQTVHAPKSSVERRFLAPSDLSMAQHVTIL
jgi:hypothetical protein